MATLKERDPRRANIEKRGGCPHVDGDGVCKTCQFGGIDHYYVATNLPVTPADLWVGPHEMGGCCSPRLEGRLKPFWKARTKFRLNRKHHRTPLVDLVLAPRA